MGFPFQISDAELKKSSKKPLDGDTDEQASNTTNKSNRIENGPQIGSQKPESEPCPETELCPEELGQCLDKTGPCPEKPEILPDFCGLFEKAMQPFCPPPSVVINIELNLGDKDGSCECPEPSSKQPMITSFADKRGDN